MFKNNDIRLLAYRLFCAGSVHDRQQKDGFAYARWPWIELLLNDISNHDQYM